MERTFLQSFEGRPGQATYYPMSETSYPLPLVYERGKTCHDPMPHAMYPIGKSIVETKLSGKFLKGFKE